ncbi:type II secretion system protein [Massilia terrae]|uniref:Prepilin-type N-terminal cleavage/methylation domain-containing protein n=1 Tax=Massilia terrae TaxID=1811224 RepID=A0ABT2CUJ8_9BURK|nr:prepilin-type N-terminal cleavage/methylation domain-containing protein [Massilia terrae]MCS0657624.1 prepilin-type N-terminal cleavage/methylation domain-containing protein [Massilia terrae]
MRKTAQRGFTLVEAIVVIVIIGILSAAVAVFIRAPVRGYVDAVGRAELTDTADLALRRIARDLRRALPNSIRVSNDGHSIEFLLTRAGGRYLAAEDGVADGSSTFALDFVNAASTQFSVVGAMPSLSSRVQAGNYIVVYNLGPGFPITDAYQFNVAGVGKNIALVSGVTLASGTVQSIALASNPFAAQSTPMPSPNQRFQVVKGPVTYTCGSVNGVLTLTRLADYDIRSTMSDSVGNGSSAVVADRLDHCNGLFNYSDLNSTHRSGLVIMSLGLLARNTSDPAVTLVHQVHVDNTP